MLTFAYPAVFERDEECLVMVSFPDFPTAHTDGRDANEAAAQAIDLPRKRDCLCDGRQGRLPKPSRLKRGQKLVPVPLWIVAKLALYWAIRELGMTHSELARRLNVRETVVIRMLDPSHDTRQDRIQAALEALGKRVVMAYDDAA